MPVTTKFSGMTNTAIVQFDNSVKGLAVSTIEQGNIDKIISAKKDITPTDTSTGKLIDNINMYEVGDFKIEHDAILTPVETIYGDQLVSAIKDVSTVITIHKDLSDETVKWDKEQAKTEHYVEFPVNGRSATWLDLIKYQTWYIMGYGHEYMSGETINSELDSLWNNSTNYTVTQIGYYYYSQIDGLNYQFTDMDPFENITMNKYQELRNIMCANIGQDEWEDIHDYIEFVFEACFTGIKLPENDAIDMTWAEDSPHLGGVIKVYIDDSKIDYYNENRDAEIPLYVFKFSKKILSIDSNNLGFNVQYAYTQSNMNISEAGIGNHGYILHMQNPLQLTLSKLEPTRALLASATSLTYSNIITNNFKKINNNDLLYINAVEMSPAPSGPGGPFLTYMQILDNDEYRLCIFPDYYDSNKFRLIPIGMKSSLISISSLNGTKYKYNVGIHTITYNFYLERPSDYGNQYTGIKQSVTQYPVVFGGTLEFNKNITSDGKPNNLENYDSFVKLIVIPQATLLNVVPRPPIDLTNRRFNGFGYNQNSWLIPLEYTSTVDFYEVGTPPRNKKTYYAGSYNMFTQTAIMHMPYLCTTFIYIFGNIPLETLQKSNASVTVHLQNVMQSTPIQTQTVQKINFFFSDFVPATQLSYISDAYNLEYTLCADSLGNPVEMVEQWANVWNTVYNPAIHIPIAICKTLNLEVYGMVRPITLAIFYWFVNSKTVY